jgi:hypothetical protein
MTGRNRHGEPKAKQSNGSPATDRFHGIDRLVTTFMET